jgi:hypothetical protein
MSGESGGPVEASCITVRFVGVDGKEFLPGESA